MATSTKKTETAAQAEANKIETVNFEVDIKGKKVELEAPRDPNDASFDFIIEYEKGNTFTAMSLILGKEQLDTLREVGASGNDFVRIFDAYTEASGLGEG